MISGIYSLWSSRSSQSSESVPYDYFKIYTIVPIIQVDLKSIQAIEVVSVIQVICHCPGNIFIWLFQLSDHYLRQLGWYITETAHSRTSPMKSGVAIRLCKGNEFSKATVVFGLLWTLLWLKILTLWKENAEIMGIGCHCFKCWNVFIIATEKKMFMQKGAFFFLVSCELTRWQNS